METIKKTTLAEQAYEYIKDMIITGKLAPVNNCLRKNWLPNLESAERH